MSAMTALGAALDALPKVELHCHLEGAMRPETVVDLARANAVPLPTSDPTELYRYDSLDGFLRVFWLVQSTLARREDWARLGYEAVVDGAGHGVVHREAFFTPARHLAGGQDLADIVAGLAEGVAAAEAETGATCLLIADMDRAFGPAAGLEQVELLAGLRRSGAPGMERVIGVGMDSTEQGIDPVSYLAAYESARAAGFRLTAHQGENSPAAAIADCLDVLGVERIDHGLPVLDDPGLVARMAGDRIPITVCPTSNIRIANAFARLEDHTLPQMRRAGLLATVNTDDPALILPVPAEGVRDGRGPGPGTAPRVSYRQSSQSQGQLGGTSSPRAVTGRTAKDAHTFLSPSAPSETPQSLLYRATRSRPRPPPSPSWLSSTVGRSGESSWTVSTTQKSSSWRVTVRGVRACTSAFVTSSLTTRRMSSTRYPRSCCVRWMPTKDRASHALTGQAGSRVSWDQKTVVAITAPGG
jgi:adenosine deaminase